MHDDQKLNTTPAETQARVISKRAVNKGRKKVLEKASRLGRLNVEYVPTADVKPNDYNPNRQSDHDFALLLSSMEDDGFTQPIIVAKDLTIIDGEHRWRAANALGLKEVPVVRVDMSPEQARVATIRHNRARGSHDADLEAAVIRDLQELGALDWAQEALMMDDEEINRLLNDIGAPDALAGDEFSDAWIPDKVGDDDRAAIEAGATEAQERQASDGVVSTAQTAEAVEIQRKREGAVGRAKTEQDRAQARMDHAIYRLSLVFTEEQSKIVKAALGADQATNLLALCQAHLDAHPEVKV